MKQWKKGMAVILTLVLVVAGFNISAKFAIAADTPQFFADTITAEPGGQIEVPINISGNTGIMGIGLNIRFDKQVLTPVDDVKQTSLLVGQFNNSVEGALRDGTDNFDVLWQGTDNMTEDGELFTLKFQVAEKASGSTDITLTLLEDETFNEQYENVTVDCKTVKVTVTGAEVPDETAAPTKAPKPEESEPTVNTPQPDETTEPDDPIAEPDETAEPEPTLNPEQPDEPTAEPDEPTVAPGEYWEGKPFEVYLYYESSDLFDSDGESINGYSDKVYTKIDGNGNYAVSFTAKKTTDNIYLLQLSTLDTPEYLPAGLKISPTTLRIGEKIYEIGECSETESWMYEINIRHFNEDHIAGNVAVPVAAGDTVTVYFRVEGMDNEGTSGSQTLPPGSTDVPSAVSTQEPATPQVPNASNSGSNNSNGVKTPYYPLTGYSSVKKIPKKVSLKSVKAAGKKKLKVKWKWLTGAKGFQVQYAMNRSFTKSRKTVNASAYAEEKTLKGMKSKKTYYVRVRAYNYVSGMKYYGSWSNIKKCKVK